MSNISSSTDDFECSEVRNVTSISLAFCVIRWTQDKHWFAFQTGEIPSKKMAWWAAVRSTPCPTNWISISITTYLVSPYFIPPETRASSTVSIWLSFTIVEKMQWSSRNLAKAGKISLWEEKITVTGVRNSSVIFFLLICNNYSNFLTRDGTKEHVAPLSPNHELMASLTSTHPLKARAQSGHCCELPLFVKNLIMHCWQ